MQTLNLKAVCTKYTISSEVLIVVLVGFEQIYILREDDDSINDTLHVRLEGSEALIQGDFGPRRAGGVAQELRVPKMSVEDIKLNPCDSSHAVASINNGEGSEEGL